MWVQKTTSEGDNYSLVWFDYESAIGNISGKTVESAILTIYPVASCINNGSIQAWIIGSLSSGLWPENINYSEFIANYQNIDFGQASGISGSNPINIDIKTAFESSWAADSANLGIKIKSTVLDFGCELGTREQGSNVSSLHLSVK